MIPQLHIQEVQDDDAMLSLWLRNPTHIASMWCSSSAWPYGSERHSDWWCVRWWNIGIYTKDKSTHFMVKWCDMHRDSMIFHRLSWIIDDNPWNTHSIYTSHHSWMFFFFPDLPGGFFHPAIGVATSARFQDFDLSFFMFLVATATFVQLLVTWRSCNKSSGYIIIYIYAHRYVYTIYI